MQVDNRQRFFKDITTWRRLSAQRASKTPWLITMDEIGRWYTGAKIDKDDPTDDLLRQHVLWPTFLAGGAGVEWYSGARQAHNDLTTEDFRVRGSLWAITRIAREFIETHVPIWDLSPVPEIEDSSITIEGLDAAPAEVLPAASFYAASNDSYFLAYLIKRQNIDVNMPSGTYEQLWLDPVSGKVINKGELLISNDKINIVLSNTEQKTDWVVLLKKKSTQL